MDLWANNFGSRLGKSGRKPICFAEFQAAKRDHPYAVVLMQIGSFFEAVGVDAIMLVEHVNLAPMGKKEWHQAGTPLKSVKQTVARLCQAGLTVAIYCQREEGSRKNERKERVLADVCSPSDPGCFVASMTHSDQLPVDASSDASCIAGVELYQQGTGHTLRLVWPAEERLAVESGLSNEALLSRISVLLAVGRLQLPLHIRRGAPAQATEMEKALQRRLKQQARPAAVGGRTTASYSELGTDGLRNHLISLQKLQPGQQLELLDTRSHTRPKPLPLCTVLQLGLSSLDDKIPSLLDHVLPRLKGPKQRMRTFVGSLLHLPPPPWLAAQIQVAMRLLMAQSKPLPNLSLELSSASIHKMLERRQANTAVFQELHTLLQTVASICEDEELRPWADAALAARDLPVLPEDDLDGLRLAGLCREAAEVIGRNVPRPGPLQLPLPELKGGSWGGMGTEWEEAGWPEGGSGWGVAKELRQAAIDLLLELRYQAEEFRMLVDCQQLPRMCALAGEVDFRFQLLEAEWAAVVQLLVDALRQPGAMQKHCPVLELKEQEVVKDRRCPVVRFKGLQALKKIQNPLLEAVLAPGAPMELFRKGDAQKCYVTPDLKRLAAEYQDACQLAQDAAHEALKELALKLQPHQRAVVTASRFAVAASALYHLANEASRRGWTLPSLPPVPPADASCSYGEAGGHGPLRVRDMWPFWLPQEEAYCNSLDMLHMIILTGPNMAGKSTVLRSTCAVALLANCGLAVPAKAAEVPWMDAFMLRHSVGDSPLDGSSLWGNEMKEMSNVFADATPQSLVLADEVGKGTDRAHATAVCGACLNKLDALGCRGILTTHLHALLDLIPHDPASGRMLRLPEALQGRKVPLRLQRSVMMRMGDPSPTPRPPGGQEEVQNANVPQGRFENGRWVPSYQLLPGASRESTAIQVAREQGIPEHVCQRAERLERYRAFECL